MKAERRLPLLGKRTTGLPRLAVKLDGPLGGLAECRNAASARVLAQADAPAVVQRLPAGFGERHLGIRPEPDGGEPPVDPDALTPRLGDPAIQCPVNPEAQPASASPVAVDSGPADRPHERGGECPRPLLHGVSLLVVYHLLLGRIHRIAMDCKGRSNAVYPTEYVIQ